MKHSIAGVFTPAAAFSLIAFSGVTAVIAGETTTYIQPVNLQTLFASPVDVSSVDRIEREQALNFSKNLDLDEFRLTGFVASRRPEASPVATADYRTYLGLRYQDTVADSVQLSGHTFYGAGSYDGDNSYVNPNSGALPDEVRAERGFSDEVLAELRAKGHKVIEPLGQTSANSIAVTPNGLLGAPDPRTRGAAAVGQ